MEKDEVDRIRQILEAHKNKPPVYELPADSGAIVGELSDNEVDSIIAEFEKSINKVELLD